jgi:hypothetical protein
LAEALLPPTGSDAGTPPPDLTLDSEAADSEAPEIDEAEQGPLRRCIATGDSLAKDRLIRFVVAPDGIVVPDLDHKLPGRGLYVLAERAAIDLAVKKKAFARAARRPVTVPDDLAERLAGLLATRCRHLLGLARRAGQAVAGYDRVEEWLKDDRAKLLLQACDGAAGGRAKLAAKARDIPEVAVLTAAELAEPFGRDHIIHVALARGGLAQRLQTDLARLKGLRAFEKVREA